MFIETAVQGVNADRMIFMLVIMVHLSVSSCIRPASRELATATAKTPRKQRGVMIRTPNLSHHQQCILNPKGSGGKNGKPVPKK